MKKVDEEIEVIDDNEKKNVKNKKDKGNKKIFLIGGILLACALIVGVVLLLTSKKEEPKKVEEKPVEKEEEKEPESSIDSKNVKIIDVNSNTRPYAIMINCKSEALPQAGLDKAYIVYEIMVEGGITRMLALFKDVEVNKIGSARSARNHYFAYVFEHDAVYVHAGGQLESTQRMANEKIAHIDVDGKYGFRDKELAKKRAWEHTLFTDTTRLAKGMKDYNYRTTTTQKNLLHYDAEEIDLEKFTDKKEVKNVTIKYSNYRTSIYKYNEESKSYLRFMNNQKNTDLVTGEQYKVKNIIVYGLTYETYYLRGCGYQKLKNIGKGEGYYITDGYAIPITWEKKDEASQTVYKYKETGEDLIVNDGNTYIQIYPTNGGKLTMN